MFPDARFDAGDIRELPYDDGAFDLVTAVETLQHLPPSDRVAVYGEVERVLAPEGDLLLIERQRPSPHPHVHAFTDQDWELLDGRFAHVRSVPVMTVPLHRWYERLATRRSPGTAPERMAAATGSPAFYWSAVPVLAVAAPMEPILSRLLPPEQGSYRAALYTAGR